MFSKKLINFDLHSDAKCNKIPHRISVANWVNWAINEFNIEEYYWVVPKSILNNTQMREHCFSKISEMKGKFGKPKKIYNKTSLYGNFTNIDYKYSSEKFLKQTFIVDKETSSIIAQYAYLPEDENIIKVSNNEELKTENQLIEYVAKHFKDNKNGRYNFIAYIKEVLNKNTNEIHLRVYPDKQRLIQM